MEQRTTQFADNRTNEFSFAGFNTASDSNDYERLNNLLKINAETARIKSEYKSEQEKFEVGLMKKPLSAEQAFSYFGFLIGSIPPISVLTKIVIDSSPYTDNSGVITFGLVVTLITTIVGYFSGKKVGNIISKTEKLSWSKMILLTPLIGLIWGLVTGGAGGFIVFLIGAIFGGIIGGAVGFTILPVFTIFHRLLKKGEFIETAHFLPLAFGIVLTLCAFILGI